MEGFLRGQGLCREKSAASTKSSQIPWDMAPAGLPLEEKVYLILLYATHGLTKGLYTLRQRTESLTLLRNQLEMDQRPYDIS